MNGAGTEEDLRRIKRKKKKVARDPETGSGIVDPSSPTSEAFRTLRTNLLYAFVDDPPRVVLVTSPGPGEGKSTTCANLGVTLSQAQKSCLILDCDLRKPALHKMFGLRNFHGLLEVLVGEQDIEEVWEEPRPGLKTVTAGPVPPNPSELLGSKKFADLLDQVRPRFDYVLIDAPPINLVSDPIILSTQADGVLLVVDAKKAGKADVRNGVRSLQAVGARVMGTVINKFEGPKGAYYGYGGHGY